MSEESGFKSKSAWANQHYEDLTTATPRELGEDLERFMSMGSGIAIKTRRSESKNVNTHLTEAKRMLPDQTLYDLIDDLGYIDLNEQARDIDGGLEDGELVYIALASDIKLYSENVFEGSIKPLEKNWKELKNSVIEFANDADFFLEYASRLKILYPHKFSQKQQAGLEGDFYIRDRVKNGIVSYLREMKAHDHMAFLEGYAQAKFLDIGIENEIPITEEDWSDILAWLSETSNLGLVSARCKNFALQIRPEGFSPVKVSMNEWLGYLSKIQELVKFSKYWKFIRATNELKDLKVC